MQPLPLKLAPGSDLRLSLEELAQREGISGFVLGVVGNPVSYTHLTLPTTPYV